MQVLVLYYSAYGHIHAMAEAAAEGARSVDGVEAILRQVPETLAPEILAKTGVLEARQAFGHIPVATIKDLEEADGIIFGAPSRFGMMASQMKSFLDSTGGLWARGALAGKVGSVISSSGTQHGGNEATILSFHTVLLHHGMLIAGLPYTFEGQSLMSGITGNSPYGATTIAGGDGSRRPSANELDGARYQGRLVAELVSRLNR